MARLPKPGGDDGSWGDILNSFLSVEHNADGTLKNVARPSDVAAGAADGSITTAKLADGAVTNAKLDSTTQTSLANANSAIQSVNTKTGTSISLALDDLSDVSTGSAADGQMLVKSGSSWQAATPVNSVAGRTGDVTILENDVSGLTDDLARRALGPGSIVQVAASSTVALSSGATYTSDPFNALNVSVIGASPVATWEWHFQGSQSASGTLYCSPTGQNGTWTAIRTVATSSYAGKQVAFDRGPVLDGSPWLQLIITNGSSAQSAPTRVYMKVEGTPTP